MFKNWVEKERFLQFCWKLHRHKGLMQLDAIEATGYTTCQKSGAHSFFLVGGQHAQMCSALFRPKKARFVVFCCFCGNFFDGLLSSRLWRSGVSVFFFCGGSRVTIDFRLVPCQNCWGTNRLTTWKRVLSVPVSSDMTCASVRFLAGGKFWKEDGNTTLYILLMTR